SLTYTAVALQVVTMSTALFIPPFVKGGGEEYGRLGRLSVLSAPSPLALLRRSPNKPPALPVVM
ncbi:MAG: hypothetical protein Q8J86_09385, partial [Desulfurivibrionaceae bacterium]|nr:hypothetical protein [Desulfurivibrionaceae bacterium]